ncbi:MAG: MFS transporter [Corynebacterium sp.]|nr:MFS transporter [Corynebacterium sp.]
MVEVKLGRNFYIIFFAALVSGLGDALIPIAFAIQAHRIDSSGRGLTLVLIALWTGRFISSSIVQRIPSPQRPAAWMIFSDITRMLAQVLLVGWIVLIGTNLISAFMVSSFVYGVATAFFNPARFSLLSMLFSDAQRTKVNGFLSMLGDVLFVVGPLIGTALVFLIGFNNVLLIDAIAFLLSIVLIIYFWPIKAIEDSHIEEENGTKVEEDIKSSTALPRWVNVGLVTWFISSLATGFLGSAAPTLVMARFSEESWGWIAAAGAIGSLLGSAATITSLIKNVKWNYKQLLACIFVSLQIVALLYAPILVAIALATALGAALVTASGIDWDVLGQSLKDPKQVHQFATRDQLAFTTGIPAGMILFAIGAGHSSIVGLIVVIGLLGAAAICVNAKLWKLPV